MLTCKNYWLADYVKLFFAFVVVAIHAGLKISIQSEPVRAVIEYAESLAVPMFFGMTGYLLEEKLSCNRDKERRIIFANLMKYVRLYVVLSVLYIPLTVYGIFQDLCKSSDKPVYRFIALVKNYLLVGEQFYSWQLWYLLATIFGMAVLLLAPPP